MDEHNIQKVLVAWFRQTYPSMSNLFFAIPNGGARDLVTAKRLKEEGVLAGVPDLFLAVPRHGYPGLWLELKTEAGVLSSVQKKIQGELSQQGYAVATAKGYHSAKSVLIGYLDAIIRE